LQRQTSFYEEHNQLHCGSHAGSFQSSSISSSSHVELGVDWAGAEHLCLHIDVFVEGL
jgi:hypothetical protein